MYEGREAGQLGRDGGERIECTYEGREEGQPGWKLPKSACHLVPLQP